MDLFIHTLTGTVFELRVSPFETIQSIKSKVQRLEGIPMSQQHLIWRSLELEDGYCLHDYGIKSGATLTLVLAMRGGPINMRRVSLEEPSLQEMAEYMDENRDELWDKIMNDNKQVTLLVYREGDQLNFFRVYDGSPGTLSPYSDSISATSYNGHDDETTPANKEKEEENLITKDKMRYLRQQITSKSTKKLSTMQQPSRPSSKVLPSANLSKRRMQFAKQSKRDATPCYVTQNSDTNSNHSVQYENTPSPIKLDTMPTELKVKGVTRNQFPAINRKGETTKDSEQTELITPNEVSDTSLPSNLSDSSAATDSPHVKSTTTLPGLHNNSGSLLRTNVEDNSTHKPSRTKGRSLKPLGAVDKSVSNKFLQQMIKKYSPAPPASSDKNESNGGGTLPRAKKCGSGNSVRTKETGGTLPRAKEANGGSLPRLQPSVYTTENYLDAQLDETLKHSQLPDIIRDPVEYENYKNLLNWVYPKGKEDGENVSMKNFKPSIEKENNAYSRPLSKTRRKVAEGRPSSRVRSSKHFAQGSLPHLPPVHGDHRNLPTLTGKKKPRCSICTKKLGLATTYQCRCGSKFCAKHRYPEAHTCTYDYKAEGRRLLERSNPVVTAPKLPKI